MISGEALTGRDSELATLRRALSGVGNYAGVVIAGAAGVGKTRLARELLTQAAAAGTRTNWVVGTASARPIPLGAFMAALGDTINEPSPSVRRVINSLVSQQRQGRITIGVDDAHLLDGFSAHVVHQLAQTREARLVVTVRTGAGEPDAVRALWKDGLLARLDLEPLSAESTRAMVEAVLEGPVDARSAQRFWRLTGGNALFLQQLLKDQVAAGRVRRVAGVWIWDGDVAVSQNMTDLVGTQLDRLSPELATVVDALSQCEPLRVDVLADLVGRAPLEAAEQMRLITVDRSNDQLSVRLAHPLFGELRRAAVGEMHLSKVRGTLAQRLAGHTDGDPQVTVRRALLTLESDLPPDPPLYTDAARHTMRLLDLELAERFAKAAADAGSEDAAEVMAVNRFLAGDGDSAEEFLRELSERDDGDRHRWTTLRAANLIWMLGRPREAERLLAALAGPDETEDQRAARYSVEACVDAVFARCAEAERKAREALDSGALSDQNAMLAAVALVMAAGALGHAEDIGVVTRAAQERAAKSYESSHMRFWFAGVYARACRLTGRIEECRRAADTLSALAQDMPSLAYANLVFMAGVADLMSGDVGSAVKKLHEALAGVEKHGVTTGLRPACVFALAEAHAKLGEAEAAAEMVAEARQSVRPDALFMQTGLALATGWALAAAGSLQEAIDTVLVEAAVARDRGQLTHELACLQAAVQWGVRDGLDVVAQRAAELSAQLRLPLADAVALHAKALLARDGEGLLAASTAYQKVGDRATAADTAAQAAVAFTGAQSRSRGLFAASVAAQMASECGGLCTPATRSPATPTPLTGRQREVAELVAAGLANKEIADKLVTSVRTVEGHILRACQRVGATSRAELARIMRAGPG
ncbi:LuxR family transcriptional regulator [Mycobacterium sp. ACS4331]|uniref:LuxR C-terminal-related transcriptional regulator n=1 Tax=Mycobacterium sp. ACS4331 TaxID=1834121 RepID=UPI0007FDFE03|nr:LuxR family transcriptional regulator [Mycobacterium sp. ACS4331]OBF13007.1 LuxR family transcriptional regulator [Mycobacterium sp. ACS4331]